MNRVCVYVNVYQRVAMSKPQQPQNLNAPKQSLELLTQSCLRGAEKGELTFGKLMIVDEFLNSMII